MPPAPDKPDPLEGAEPPAARRGKTGAARANRSARCAECPRAAAKSAARRRGAQAPTRRGSAAVAAEMARQEPRQGVPRAPALDEFAPAGARDVRRSSLPTLRPRSCSSTRRCSAPASAGHDRAPSTSEPQRWSRTGGIDRKVGCRPDGNRLVHPGAPRLRWRSGSCRGGPDPRGGTGRAPRTQPRSGRSRRRAGTGGLPARSSRVRRTAPGQPSGRRAARGDLGNTGSNRGSSMGHRRISGPRTPTRTGVGASSAMRASPNAAPAPGATATPWIAGCAEIPAGATSARARKVGGPTTWRDLPRAGMTGQRAARGAADEIAAPFDEDRVLERGTRTTVAAAPRDGWTSGSPRTSTTA